jgi:hypothetical protein
MQSAARPVFDFVTSIVDSKTSRLARIKLMLYKQKIAKSVHPGVTVG